ncbi:hypothetical protein Tco_0662364 [Tanacetum coccineum]
MILQLTANSSLMMTRSVTKWGGVWAWRVLGRRCREDSLCGCVSGVVRAAGVSELAWGCGLRVDEIRLMAPGEQGGYAGCRCWRERWVRSVSGTIGRVIVRVDSGTDRLVGGGVWGEGVNWFVRMLSGVLGSRDRVSASGRGAILHDMLIGCLMGVFLRDVGLLVCDWAGEEEVRRVWRGVRWWEYQVYGDEVAMGERLGIGAGGWGARSVWEESLCCSGAELMEVWGYCLGKDSDDGERCIGTADADYYEHAVGCFGPLGEEWDAGWEALRMRWGCSYGRNWIKEGLRRAGGEERGARKGGRSRIVIRYREEELGVAGGVSWKGEEYMGSRVGWDVEGAASVT